MRKLVIVLLLGLLLAGSAFAQWGYGYNPAPLNMQTISGTLQIINGVFAIVSPGNQVYYAPSLQQYYGVNGMYLNTAVTVYGNITNNNYCEPFSFLVYGKWYNLPIYNYYYYYYAQPYAPPTQPVYVPVPQPRSYPVPYGTFGLW